MPSLGSNSRLYLKYNLNSLREILTLRFILEFCGLFTKKVNYLLILQAAALFLTIQSIVLDTVKQSSLCRTSRTVISRTDWMIQIWYQQTCLTPENFYKPQKRGEKHSNFIHVRISILFQKCLQESNGQSGRETSPPELRLLPLKASRSHAPHCPFKAVSVFQLGLGDEPHSSRLLLPQHLAVTEDSKRTEVIIWSRSDC